MDAISERLLTFVKSKGTEYDIAKKIGKSHALFTRLRKDELKPSMDTVNSIKGVYSDLDLEWLITGKSGEENNFSYPVHQPSDIEKSNMELKSENEALKRQVEEMQKDKETYRKALNEAYRVAGNFNTGVATAEDAHDDEIGYKLMNALTGITTEDGGFIPFFG